MSEAHPSPGGRKPHARGAGAAPRRKHADYPVGIPISPPPDLASWPAPAPISIPAPDASISLPPSLPAPARAPARSPFQADLALAVKGMLVLGLVLVCMVTGYFWFGRPARPRSPDLAAQLPGAPKAPAASAKGPPARPGGDAPAKTDTPPAPPGPAQPPEVPPLPPVPLQPESAPGVVTFQKHVLPIFTAKCLSCHGARPKRGGLDVRTMAALRAGGDSGPGINPGPIEDTPLWEGISSGRMPPGRSPKLTDAEKKIIQDWLTGGARPQ